MTIQIYATGGTIDKVYFDAQSLFEVGDPQITALMQLGNTTIDFAVESLMRKDSLDMTDADRELIASKVASTDSKQIIITHGTDGMVASANALKSIEGKTIVFMGAMQPARMRDSDALFNAGAAVTAVQILPPGVYLSMNGHIFDPKTTHKNATQHRFEPDE